MSVKYYLTEIKANLHEWKTSFNLDLGNLKEIIYCVHSNYPSLNKILEHFGSVIKSLVITKSKTSHVANHSKPYRLNWKPNEGKRDITPL